MPAFLSNSSVGRTFSCSLSSTPVRQISSRSRSKLSTAAAIFLDLSSVLSFAWLYLTYKKTKYFNDVVAQGVM